MERLTLGDVKGALAVLGMIILVILFAVGIGALLTYAPPILAFIIFVAVIFITLEFILI